MEFKPYDDDKKLLLPNEDVSRIDVLVEKNSSCNDLSFLLLIIFLKISF